MTTSLESLRREYSGRSLAEADVDSDPLRQFDVWLREAFDSGAHDAHAMILATASTDGDPSARVVLLKGLEEGTFNFFTNYDSRKGRELAKNPRATLLFFWPLLERQVRIAGRVTKLSEEKNRAYFSSRPRESQLAAWASAQSEEVSGRTELEETFERMRSKFDGSDVPLPTGWGGFGLLPQTIEFWQGRPNRLHDRLEYRRSGSEWRVVRLSP